MLPKKKKWKQWWGKADIRQSRRTIRAREANSKRQKDEKRARVASGSRDVAEVAEKKYNTHAPNAAFPRHLLQRLAKFAGTRTTHMRSTTGVAPEAPEVHVHGSRASTNCRTQTGFHNQITFNSKDKETEKKNGFFKKHFMWAQCLVVRVE